jgi:hypothetical protein
VAPIGAYSLGDIGQRAKPQRIEVIPDKGCEVSPSCLRCPLPQCVYDEPPKRAKQEAGKAQERRSCEVL